MQSLLPVPVPTACANSSHRPKDNSNPMIDHLFITVSNLAKSERFYRKALAPLATPPRLGLLFRAKPKVSASVLKVTGTSTRSKDPRW